MKVVKISDKEKASITGGYGPSSTVECDGATSAWPIDCASKYIDCTPYRP